MKRQLTETITLSITLFLVVLVFVVFYLFQTNLISTKGFENIQTPNQLKVNDDISVDKLPFNK
jgi:hypothetical protein